MHYIYQLDLYNKSFEQYYRLLNIYKIKKDFY